MVLDYYLKLSNYIYAIASLVGVVVVVVVWTCNVHVLAPKPAPTPAPGTSVECVKEREKFAQNKLPVEPAFQEGSCWFLPKQCNAEKCFCVGPKTGKRKQGKLEVPLGHEYDCSSKYWFKQCCKPTNFSTQGFRCLFVFSFCFLFTQYITQIVQTQTLHPHVHVHTHNKLILSLLPHSHNYHIYIYILKQNSDVTVWFIMRA